MTAVQFKVDRAKVLDEIRRTTSYTGTKFDDEGTLIDRVSAIEEDDEALSRFWDESTGTVVETVKRFVVSDNSNAEGLTLDLELSSAWDAALKDSMQKDLFSFFVMNMTAKWFMFTKRDEVEKYSILATASLESFQRKAFYKRRPQRPTYN